MDVPTFKSMVFKVNLKVPERLSPAAVTIVKMGLEDTVELKINDGLICVRCCLKVSVQVAPMMLLEESKIFVLTQVERTSWRYH